MTDLDFDELDRAVNSLMSNKKTAESSETQPATPLQTDTTSDVTTLATPSVELEMQAESIAPPIQDNNIPSSVDTQAIAEIPSILPAQPAVQVQKKSSGMYMDMMPPKSSAKTTVVLQDHKSTELASKLTATTESSAAPAPFHDIIPPKTATKSPVRSEPIVTVPQSIEPSMQEDSPAVQAPGIDLNAQLDSILGTPDTTAQQPQEVLPAKEGPAVSEESRELNDEALQEEVASPFLADAKVEKRPLGGVAQSSAAPFIDPLGASINNEGQTAEEEAAGEEPQVETEYVPTPPEFHEELLAVEADAQQTDSNDQSIATQSATVTDTTATIATGVTPVGPASITQQYKEKSSSGDQSHAPIYDTNVQPLAHPAKKKSGWGVVLWIVVFIVVCVGIAAALYFTGIM